jgi:hypothetical protein
MAESKRQVGGDENSRRLFKSVDEAQAHRPQQHEKWKLYTVKAPDGSQFYTWSDGYAGTYVNVARFLGYTAFTPGGKPASPDRVASLLAQLTPEERQAVLAQFTSKAAKNK